MEEVVERVSVSLQSYVDADITYTPWVGDHWEIGFKVTRRDGRTEYVFIAPSTEGDEEISEDPTLFFYIGTSEDYEKNSSIPFRMFLTNRREHARDPLDPAETAPQGKYQESEPETPQVQTKKNKTSGGYWDIRSEGKYDYLRFSYNEEFLYALKQHVPAPYRWWDAFHKEWRIDHRYRQEVEQLFRAYF